MRDELRSVARSGQRDPDPPKPRSPPTPVGAAASPRALDAGRRPCRPRLDAHRPGLRPCQGDQDDQVDSWVLADVGHAGLTGSCVREVHARGVSMASGKASSAAVLKRQNPPCLSRDVALFRLMWRNSVISRHALARWA